jgi:hypothetical protein
MPCAQWMFKLTLTFALYFMMGKKPVGKGYSQDKGPYLAGATASQAPNFENA